MTEKRKNDQQDKPSRRTFLKWGAVSAGGVALGFAAKEVAQRLQTSNVPGSQITPEQPVPTGIQKTEGVPTPLPHTSPGPNNERQEYQATPTPSSTPFGQAIETQFASQTQQVGDVDSSTNPSIAFPTAQLVTLILGLSIATYFSMIGAKLIASKLKLQFAV